MINDITVDELATLLGNHEVVLIDVREPHEFHDGHIDHAVSLPLSVFAQKFNRADYPEDKVIVLQCQAGVRSMKACHIANDLDSRIEVMNLVGGLNAWRDSGFPITK